ncbi:unnamed protein product [Lepeophtheirus salmonis]|uniref:(salmon louse) hypothetical protein n=1 Tax=Lepeophtheirus salmonis TaxID=72036 RepID=A0A817FD90_LEPSM|nr:unnamed protein product [Lepeophtheirus salmonis]CAG9477963.1 unnamed protein product [Lepeophtheirus salmonis]
MGFLDVNYLSDGDSDKPDEETIGDSDHVDEIEENIPSNSKKHARRRWRKDYRECPISQSVITLPPFNLAIELKVFIGGLLLSATCPLPNKRKYWSSEDNVPKVLANSIRRDRFINILHNIYFHDNTIETNDRAITNWNFEYRFYR